ncbi:CstA-like transporter-associated (seleno)protein [Streptomyces sp. NPDC096013]|uniref:CstA-like transporter-associated (seleno)protein n=1 Tax=Streptomyces sp. NPDC096013 TaxID=3366069 RepID=UPI0038273DDE
MRSGSVSAPSAAPHSPSRSGRRTPGRTSRHRPGRSRPARVRRRRPARRSAPTRAAGRTIRGVRCYVRELTDESVYGRYVARVRRGRPEAEVPGPHDVERPRSARREAGPRQGFRCCRHRCRAFTEST